MPQNPENTCLLTKVKVRNDKKIDFVDWQAKLNTHIAASPGFLSLEILSPVGSYETSWIISQRFYRAEDTINWRDSNVRQNLLEELKLLLDHTKSDNFSEIVSESVEQKGGVTEIFVTEVSFDMEEAYRAWMAKMHRVEANFPGFKGCYVQSPGPGKKNWITLLQFDTVANLDRWLDSPERKKVLEESKMLIASLDTHRVISPYAGWFATVSEHGTVPAAWKQTMIVLLVLFPIVMLELKFLNPHLTMLNPSLATFIGNAISVSLVSWPMVPIAIEYLGWWLNPDPENRRRDNILGTMVVCLLFVLEIAIFWKLL